MEPLAPYLPPISVAPLVFLRIAVILRFIPLFTGGTVPVLSWLSLAAITTLAVCPTDQPVTDTRLISFLALGLKEGFVGVTLGLLVRLAFSVLENAAGLAGTAGGRFGNSELGPLLQLYTLTGMAVFFVVGGHHHLLFGLKYTFDMFPANQLIAISEDAVLSPEPVIRLFSTAFVTAVFASTPIFLAGYVADLLTAGCALLFNRVPAWGQLLRLIAVWFVAVFALGFVVDHTLSLIKSTIDKTILP